MRQLQSKKNNGVFFFNSGPKLMQKTGQLRGSKLKLKDEDKLLTLKTRYIQRTQLMRARSSFHQRQLSPSFPDPPITERQRVSYDNWHFRNLTKRINNSKKSKQLDIIKREQQPEMIITSQSNSLPKQIKPRDLPHFSSTNLQGKMNEYLNIIIRKSHQSHHEKIKKIMEGEKEQKHLKVQNMYFRRMKISQNRKKEQRGRSEPIKDQYSLQAHQIVNNLNKLLKKSRNQIEDLQQ